MPRETVGRRSEDVEREAMAQGNKMLRRVAVGALATLAFVATIGCISLAIQTHNDGLAASRATRALTQAVQAKQLTRALAQIRRSTILRGCQEENARHVATVKELNSLLARAEQHAQPKQRAQIAASRAPTILLINALAPLQHCQQVARSATR